MLDDPQQIHAIASSTHIVMVRADASENWPRAKVQNPRGPRSLGVGHYQSIKLSKRSVISLSPYRVSCSTVRRTVRGTREAGLTFSLTNRGQTMIYTMDTWNTFVLSRFFPRISKDPAKQSSEMMAATARRTATEKSAYLCAPMRDDDTIGTVTRSTPLIAWGSFNPMGPTTTCLSLVPTHQSKEHFLLLRSHTPFTSTNIVYGLIPDKVTRDLDGLNLTLEQLFERNGSSEFPLMSSLPSHVPVIPQSPLKLTQVKSLVTLAAQRAQDQARVGELANWIERYWCDPWQRAKTEFDQALKAGGSESGVPLSESQPSADAWERWWALVSHKDHVAAEIGQMSTIWQGHLTDPGSILRGARAV
jgi:hypothetical protein